MLLAVLLYSSQHHNIIYGVSYKHFVNQLSHFMCRPMDNTPAMRTSRGVCFVAPYTAVMPWLNSCPVCTVWFRCDAACNITNWVSCFMTLQWLTRETLIQSSYTVLLRNEVKVQVKSKKVVLFTCNGVKKLPSTFTCNEVGFWDGTCTFTDRY